MLGLAAAVEEIVNRCMFLMLLVMSVLHTYTLSTDVTTGKKKPTKHMIASNRVYSEHTWMTAALLARVAQGHRAALESVLYDGWSTNLQLKSFKLRELVAPAKQGKAIC